MDCCVSLPPQLISRLLSQRGDELLREIERVTPSSSKADVRKLLDEVMLPAVLSSLSQASLEWLSELNFLKERHEEAIAAELSTRSG